MGSPMSSSWYAISAGPGSYWGRTAGSCNFMEQRVRESGNRERAESGYPVLGQSDRQLGPKQTKAASARDGEGRVRSGRRE